MISRDVPGGVVAPGDVEGRPFDQVVEQWIPLAGALNALNRSMGEADLYPFVLSADGHREAGVRRPARAGPAGSGGRLTATAPRRSARSADQEAKAALRAAATSSWAWAAVSSPASMLKKPWIMPSYWVWITSTPASVRATA